MTLNSHLVLLIFFAFFSQLSLASAQKHDVRVLRDTWGVPHIFGKTDADVAFGFAIAQAEDNFKTIQEAVMMARGTMALHTGQAGAKPVWFTEEKIRENLEREYSPKDAQ